MTKLANTTSKGKTIKTANSKRGSPKKTQAKRTSGSGQTSAVKVSKTPVLKKSRSGVSPARTKGDSSWQKLEYLHGFGNHAESEAVKGALPMGQNNPQKCPLGLYAEQLSGTPFTFAKHKNQRSWQYRILPTVKHGNWKDVSSQKNFQTWVSDFTADKGLQVSPEQFRWPP